MGVDPDLAVAQAIRNRIVQLMDDALTSGSPEAVAGVAASGGRSLLDAIPMMREKIAATLAEANRPIH